MFSNQKGLANKEEINAKADTSKKMSEASKKMSVERVYQKKTQLEHILLRPDSYIGSVEPVTQVRNYYLPVAFMVNVK